MSPNRNEPAIHVASGAFKGRRLRYPRTSALRPTMQRTREAVVDSLGDDLAGVGFVDLYAGAGAVGIEALSRRAAFVRFVERESETLACLDDNLRTLGLDASRASVYRGEVESFVASGGLDDERIRIVFADPPYHEDVHSLLALLDAKAYPHVRCLVVEHRGDLTAPGLSHWAVTRSRRYGATRVTYFEPCQGGKP